MLWFLAGLCVGLLVGLFAAVVCVALGMSVAQPQAQATGTSAEPDHADALILRTWRPSKVQ